MEKFADVDAVVFDKTGTLTIGRPVVTKVIASRGKEDVNTKLSVSYVLWIYIVYLTALGLCFNIAFFFSNTCFNTWTSYLIEYLSGVVFYEYDTTTCNFQYMSMDNCSIFMDYMLYKPW